MSNASISESELAAAKSAIAAGTFKSKKVATARKPVAAVKKPSSTKPKPKPATARTKNPVRKPIASATSARPQKKTALAMWGEALKRDA